ncbi:sigma-70 family RNA polymerase sigma factor [Streptomyces sp. K1PN6]|uniref:Sigma-70 family RNA polymerase sigma factor n=2 Tax=Streptomyces acidicola TaxID=2596892 RepID=A0A5N8WY02_9ACTN|nr:sigma-70 family RNA polymerase sigma factor [Streptomyces acidicola]
MMSSTPQISTRTAGAHRAHREAQDRAATRTRTQRPPARHEPYEPYLDGLFTYCLSVLCDHDTATAALADGLALAERRRGPDAPDDRRAWLYALARWACLRKLAEAKQKRQGVHASGRHGAENQRAQKPAPGLPAELQAQRQRELTLLAWPEAAGTTPEQREALELAVRHQLAAQEVAAVIGQAPAAARELLASAACEVERTRAALAVVETGGCPSVARLTGDHQLVLSATLRRELVRHVDDCPHCRRTAERATPGRWPGTSVTPAALPVLEAPRAALHSAMAHLTRARGGAPRFDRRGFPMDPRDRAARRDRLRARAVTTTVVATVVAAPVLALWAAYRGAPPTGEGGGDRTAAARESHGADGLAGEETGEYENAGNASARPDARYDRPGKHASDVSVEVVSTPGKGAGTLTVQATGRGDTTLITLTASGNSPVHWSAHTGQNWLYLSQSSGTLAPGESLTIKVYVDHLREPAGYWSARVSIGPTRDVVSIQGYGSAPLPSRPPRPTTPGPRPTPSSPPPTSAPDPTPSDPGSADPTPTPSPSDPSPSDPSPSDPNPSDPGSPDPGSSGPEGSTLAPSGSGEASPSEG